MEFQNLEQRIIHMYLDTFPEFVPVYDKTVSEQAQKQFYDFMKDIYRILYDDPGLLFTSTHADDAHTNRFNKSADKKPELTNQMRRISKKIEDFLAVLFTIGNKGSLDKNRLVAWNELKINKNHLNILNSLGLKYGVEDNRKVFIHEEYGDLFYGWKLLTDKPGASLLSFSRCMYNSKYSYACDIYKRLCGKEEAFEKLINFLEENGYIRIDNRDNQIALDYVKNYDSKEQPVKDAWAERTHGGISAKYDPFIWQPVYFCLRLPKTKEVLSAFKSMEEELQDFIIKYNKKCDNCGYCTQTDKTGTRKPNYITVNKGKDYNLCLLFPGFNYCFTDIQEEVADSMIRCLSFIDKVLK
ncbi:hypothetical protein Ana3638_14800 [Anaerocolumna sedimenticola]|uniref:Uncharacterized protein n=1 Tax=Anaerocolumna sedimenticola TaxID=2696063 RepID=A0A6P1TNY9_9FIRM|nr:hypothetical protein [Anaerocolumna sedimenticola]QHQ61892.1 hypothetical protein Ana3638_14800 [Anaerocolumna sedimenticola]